MRDPAIWLAEILDHPEGLLVLIEGRRREHLETDRAFEMQATHLLLLLG